MQSALMTVLIFAVVGVSACQKTEEAPASAADGIFGKAGHKGRYVGIGIYTPSEAWVRLLPPIAPPQAAAKSPTPAPPVTPAPATLAEDAAIIVVVDTATGELRQCGNLSGYCLASNPWSKPAAGTSPAPLYKPPEAPQPPN